MIKKEARVHMLPTDNGTNIYLYEGKLYLFPDVEFHQMTRTGQHLYITVDEEIKEGDLHFNSKYGDEIRVANKRDVLSQKGWRDEDYEIRKIIASTDSKLLKGTNWTEADVQGHWECTNCGEWTEDLSVKCKCKPVNKIPQSFIEEYCKAGGIDEVLVEVEYLKTPNPKFDRSKGVNKNNPTYLLDETNLVPKTRNDNTIIIHPIEENKFEKQKTYVLRRLEHCNKRLKQCEEKYKGKEDKHTFHGGRELGYWQGLVEGYTLQLEWIEENL